MALSGTDQLTVDAPLSSGVVDRIEHTAELLGDRDTDIEESLCTEEHFAAHHGFFGRLPQIGQREIVEILAAAQHLADNFEVVPLYLFGFVRMDPTGGSIFPAVWSAQLAARAEGVGSALTSVLGVFHGPEALEILGVPPEEHWIMACCVSFGYPTGRWGVAPRRPVHEVSYRNRWGADPGIEISEPLWNGG